MNAKKKKKSKTLQASKRKAGRPPVPTASELISVAQLLQGAEPLPSGMDKESKDTREMLFRHAAQMWTEAEAVARIYREDGAHAASFDRWVDRTVELRAASHAYLSGKECLLFVTGNKNITRARKNLKEYFAAAEPGVDVQKRLQRWEYSWGADQFGIPAGDPRLLQAREEYQRWHNERRSVKNRGNAAKRSPGKLLRKKSRRG
jgi:hypothetical protein